MVSGEPPPRSSPNAAAASSAVETAARAASRTGRRDGSSSGRSTTRTPTLGNADASGVHGIPQLTGHRAAQIGHGPIMAQSGAVGGPEGGSLSARLAPSAGRPQLVTSLPANRAQAAS